MSYVMTLILAIVAGVMLGAAISYGSRADEQ